MTPTIPSHRAERDAILETAKHMLTAARTAPKSSGIDDIVTLIVYGKERDKLAKKMDEIGQERKAEAFSRDARNVRESDAVVLIGARGRKSLGINCGACGYKTCAAFDKAGKKRGRDFTGPTCLFKALDMGIALGSAAKTASLFNVDNRIMYRIGTAAMMLNMMPDVTVMMGVPLSARGKSPYFDRK